MVKYLPNTELLVLFICFGIARFENQRWIRARSRGMRGSNELIGACVDLTGSISLLFVLVFLVAYWYDTNIAKSLALLATSVVIGFVYSLISSIVFRGDIFIVWMIGTVAVWPILLFLIPQVTWYGLL